MKGPDFSWLDPAYKSAEYNRDSIAFAFLRKNIPGVEIQVFLGTWCGDTHDQVPPFLKLMDLANANQISLFSLDREKTYPGFLNPLKIILLPTFVFLKSGKELGRITESPRKSLLDDTFEILKRN